VSTTELKLYEHFDPRGTPEFSEARRFILQSLVEAPRTPPELQKSFMDRQPKLEAITLDSDRPSILDFDRLDPRFKRVRASLAYDRALLELKAIGIVIEENSGDIHRVTIPYRRGNHRGKHEIRGLNTKLKRRLLLSTFAHSTNPAGLADPETFKHDLCALRLNDQTLLCIDEALASFRSGRYLSCAFLLGAICEGATYAVGKALRRRHADIQSSFSNRNLQALNRALYSYLLPPHSPLGGTARVQVQKLMTFSQFMISVRNYGAHPMSPNDAGVIEQLGGEQSTALLVVEAHHWLAGWDSVLRTLIPRRRNL